MASPCMGCPPNCINCVFNPEGVSVRAPIEEIVSAEDYGCIQGHGALVRHGGQLGQMRDGRFHPVTPVGAAGLRERGSPLVVHLPKAA